MKKKLFKSLMLLVVAVSIGAFVSCKDTNEDLYNQLRTQTVNENASLQERYDDLINTLNSEIDALKAAYDAIETSKCTCDKDAFNNLKDLVDQLNNQLTGGQGGQGGTQGGVIGRLDDIDGSGSSIETVIQNLETLINNITGEGGDLETITNILTQHGNNITLLQTNYTTAQQQLADAISDLTDLKNKVDNIDPCKCNFDSIKKVTLKIEERLANVETKAQDALTLATTADSKADGAALTAAEAKSAAEAATTAATAAANLAQQAFDLAQSASDDAATAASTANSALTLAIQLSDIATQLQTQANANTEAIGNLQTQTGANTQNIQTLQSTITTINQTLSDYKELIDTNTANIASNLSQIQTNAANIQTNAANILDNKNRIDAMQTTLTQVSTDVATALTNASEALNKANTNYEAIENLKPRVEQNERDIADLKGSVETLQTNVTNLTNAYNEKIPQLESLISTNTGNISNLTTRLDNLSTDVTNLSTKVTNIEGNVTTLQTDMQELTGKVTTLETNLAQVVADCAANLVAAKQYAEAQAQAVNNELRQHIKDTLSYYYTAKEVDALLADQDVKINDNKVKIGELELSLSDLTSTVSGLSTTVDGHTTSINNINDEIAYIKQHLCECEPVDLTDILNRLTTAEGKITTNENDIAAIKQDIADRINKNITDLTEDLNTLTGKHNDLEDKVNNLNYITPEQVNDLLDVIRAKAKADSTTLANRLDGHDSDITNLNNNLADAVQDIADLTALTQILRDSIYNHEVRISTAESSIGDLQDAVNDINDELTSMKDDIKDLQDRMAVVEDSLATALKDIKELKSDVAAVQEYLAKQVTGIIVQGASNPWFGTFSTPFGVQSNMVIAFYGTPSGANGKIEFPSSETDFYLIKSEALTAKDMEMLGDAATDINVKRPLMFENGYAGKVYMTINPNTVDVTGLEPKIVNSLGDTSYISLDGVKPSTERLQFGWTRADGSGNGFYEAEAIVKPKDVQQVNGPSFNLAAVKDAAKNVKEALTNLFKNQSTSGSGKNLEAIATDVNQIVQGLRFDRSALMVSYEDPTVKDANNNPQKKQVISEYNLAATAFQPLTLQHIKDIPQVENMPGYSRINNLIDRVANTVNSKIHTFFKDFNNNALIDKIAHFKIDSIKVPAITDDLLAKFELHMDTVFIMGGLEYHFSMPVNVPVKFDKDLTIPVNINGIDVEVPIDMEKSVEVDLSNVSIETPTVVVHGHAEGHPSNVHDLDGNLVSSLIIPVLDENGNMKSGEYITIPISNLNVSVEMDAGNDTAHGGSGAGEKIYLDGKPVATVSIKDTIKTSVDIHDNIVYHLDITDTVQVDISKYIQLGYVDYLRDPSEQDGYAKDENGNLIPLKDADGNPIPGDKRGFILRFNYDMRDAAQELWGMAEGALNDINGGLLANVQDLIDEVNNTLGKINNYDNKITGTVDDYVTKIKNYLDKINKGVTKILNSAYGRVTPFAIANTSKGMKRLGTKGYPAQLSSDVTLYLTSQTMELFVPFARKHVGVTNVFKDGKSAQGGDGDCKTKLNAANSASNMNKVLDGTVRQVKMSGLAVGYTYEVAYSVLDFNGNIATRKFYFTVVQ